MHVVVGCRRVAVDHAYPGRRPDDAVRIHEQSTMMLATPLRRRRRRRTVDQPSEELGMLFDVVQQVRTVALLPLPRLHLRLDGRLARSHVGPWLSEGAKTIEKVGAIPSSDKDGTTVWLLRRGAARTTERTSSSSRSVSR